MMRRSGLRRRSPSVSRRPRMSQLSSIRTWRLVVAKRPHGRHPRRALRRGGWRRASGLASGLGGAEGLNPWPPRCELPACTRTGQPRQLTSAVYGACQWLYVAVAVLPAVRRWCSGAEQPSQRPSAFQENVRVHASPPQSVWAGPMTRSGISASRIDPSRPQPLLAQR